MVPNRTPLEWLCRLQSCCGPVGWGSDKSHAEIGKRPFGMRTRVATAVNRRRRHQRISIRRGHMLPANHRRAPRGQGRQTKWAVGAHVRQPCGHGGRGLVNGYAGDMSSLGLIGPSDDCRRPRRRAQEHDYRIAFVSGRICRSPSPTGPFVTALTRRMPGRWPRQPCTVHHVVGRCVLASGAQ
jgi:hypothetical protein